MEEMSKTPAYVEKAALGVNRAVKAGAPSRNTAGCFHGPSLLERLLEHLEGEQDVSAHSWG